MRMRFMMVLMFTAGLFLIAGRAATRADDYNIDPVHSGITFKIEHLGITSVQGRFNEVSGSFTIDKDASKCSFNASIKTETVDTNNAKRDEHLRGTDFFDVKQFPALTFKSTSVEDSKLGLKVTGDLTLHGKTKPVTFYLSGGKTAEFPKGTQRIGYTTQLTIKRSDFDMDKLSNAIGDEVTIEITVEGTKK
jgi:polyisoprenoid-binding protein YceI